jgi:glycosyltransferase involved in cell wall biosynthesis
MRIVVATVQVPFIAGGAESLAQGLTDALRAAGHPTEIVTLPFRFFPPDEVARAMRVWESETFTRLNLYEPDRVVCLKFPSYGLEHPDKIAWLLHQHREDTASAEVVDFDRRHLGGCRRFAISRRVAARLRDTTGLSSEVLYHPPPEPAKLYGAEAMPYVFFPSRLEQGKRQSLLIEAMAQVRAPVAAVLAGSGGQQGALNESIARLGLRGRVRLVGHVSADELRALYARALAVYFGPHDEDYGYVTLEAMLSRKPVITCSDSGGPLEFVEDGVTGRVVEPQAQAIAEAIDGLWADRTGARRMGEAGFARYRSLDLRWDRVVARLTERA